MTLPPPPAVQTLGNAVILHGAAVRDARVLIRAGIAATQRDGITTPLRLQQLIAALDAAMAANVPGNVPGSPPRGEWVSTQKAADHVGISARHMRRLATELRARRRGTRLEYNTNALHDYTGRRTQWPS